MSTLAPPERIRDRLEEEFAGLVLADEEWLRAEFDALVRAAWPLDRPPRGRNRPADRDMRGSARCTPRAVPTAWPRKLLADSDDGARQRSPPLPHAKVLGSRREGDSPRSK